MDMYVMGFVYMPEEIINVPDGVGMPEIKGHSNTLNSFCHSVIRSAHQEPGRGIP